jgi:NodT family efflux transporter outer membrane factor (OMF) lipoprotein
MTMSRHPTLGLLLSALLAIAATPPAAAAEGAAGRGAASAVPPCPDPFFAAFGPELPALIARAFAANPDLAAAEARIDEARATARAARAALFPSVSLTIDEAHTRGGAFSARHRGQVLDLSVADTPDVFAGQRAVARARSAQVAAATFDRDAARLALSTTLADTWISARALDERVGLGQRRLTEAEDLQSLVEARVRAGAASRADLLSQTTVVAVQRANLAALRQARDEALDNLATLVGAGADGVVLQPGGLAGLRPPRLSAAQPASLVVRRPDVQAAEARIRAAEGDLQAARRALLPQLTLSADALPAHGPLMWSVAADALAAIFDGGRRRAAVGSAAATQRETIEAYRKVLLSAAQATSDALAATAGAEAREEAGEVAAQDAAEALAIARAQYVHGGGDYPAVLLAQDQAQQAADAVVQARADVLGAAVNLYAAMGGQPLGKP